MTTMKGNIFVRESRPRLIRRPSAAQGQQSNAEKSYYFSLTVLKEDAENPYDQVGIVKLDEDLEKFILGAIKDGYSVSGETEKGHYEMLTIEFDEHDLFRFKSGASVLRDITSIC